MQKKRSRKDFVAFAWPNSMKAKGGDARFRLKGWAPTVTRAEAARRERRRASGPRERARNSVQARGLTGQVKPASTGKGSHTRREK